MEQKHAFVKMEYMPITYARSINAFENKCVNSVQNSTNSLKKKTSYKSKGG